MNIQKKVLDTIKKYSLINTGESVVVGVSGGPDSVCLLHILYSLRDELNIKGLYAVHINHMLRGDEADTDEEYVTRLCGSMGVELFTKACDIRTIAHSKGISLEEAGREARYGQFASIAEKMGIEKIAVAHNRNDQAETILMNLIRGTGIEGLRGMDYRRNEIIRPLLGIDRKEIEKYCDEKGLDPRIDSSNLENVYTRNKVRLDLIPYIDNLFNTDITERLLKTSLILKDDNDYIEENVINIYNLCVISGQNREVILKISKVKVLHRALQKRILRNAIREVKGNLKGIENVHIEDTINIMQSGRTGAELHLPSDIRIKRSYDTLMISIFNREPENFFLSEEKIIIPGETAIDALGVKVIASLEEFVPGKNYYKSGQSTLVQFFDLEKLRGAAIRVRKDGDLFKPYKSNGTKKLKEFFIDTKIPREKRDKIPVVAQDNEIVWVIGHKISDKFKVTENTKSILKLEYIKTSEENT